MSAILGDGLYYAALFGFLTVARSLLTRGVDPNHFGSYFRYPLRAAMITDNHDMFNLLLESDANVKIKRGFDGVLLFDALAKGWWKVAGGLIKGGAKPDSDLFDIWEQAPLKLVLSH